MPTEALDQLLKLERKQQRYYKKAEKFRHKEYLVEGKIGDLVRDTIHPLFPEIKRNELIYMTSGWECESPEENPFPLCVYNEAEDPALDDCIFCHQPYERK